MRQAAIPCPRPRSAQHGPRAKRGGDRLLMSAASAPSLDEASHKEAVERSQEAEGTRPFDTPDVDAIRGGLRLHPDGRFRRHGCGRRAADRRDAPRQEHPQGHDRGRRLWSRSDDALLPRRGLPGLGARAFARPAPNGARGRARASDAIVAIGEPLNYHAAHSDAEKCVFAFFSQAAAVLRPGALLAFGVIVRGEPSLTARTWSAGDDWAVLVETTEDPSAGWLRREIRTFRRIGDAWRHGHETHHVRVFDSDAVRAALSRSGFDVRTATAYGTYTLAPRRLAFFCERTGAKGGERC